MGLGSRFKTAGAEPEWRISQGTDRWGWRWSRSWTTSLRWRSGRSCCARSCRCRRRRWRSACSADARCRRRSGRGPQRPRRRSRPGCGSRRSRPSRARSGTLPPVSGSPSHAAPPAGGQPLCHSGLPSCVCYVMHVARACTQRTSPSPPPSPTSHILPANHTVWDDWAPGY